MKWNFFSFFLNSEEPFLQLNTNFLETNVVNILILVALLVYANKVNFSVTLEKRKDEIVATIESAQKDVVNATEYYLLTQKAYAQIVFWFQVWKTSYEEQKIELVESQYRAIKKESLDIFFTTDNLIKNSEKRAFFQLKHYIILIIASRVLRKFLNLSEEDKSKFVETTIAKLGEATLAKIGGFKK